MTSPEIDRHQTPNAESSSGDLIEKATGECPSLALATSKAPHIDSAHPACNTHCSAQEKRTPIQDSSSATKCQDRQGCCSKVDETHAVDTDCNDGRCGDASTSPSQASFVGGSKTSQSEQLCCDQENKPCCDDSCLEQVARRECRKTCRNPDATVSGSNPKGPAGHGTPPCSTHTQSVLSRYSAILNTMGCLCRTLVSEGRQSCCVSSTRESTGGNVRSEKLSKSCLTPISDGTCKTSRPEQRVDCRRGCCVERSAQSLPRAGPPSCGSIGRGNIGMKGPTDAETGLTGHEDHIILSISGMTCTGCETKLMRTFAQMRHLSNVKTSLVLSRAEFDIDLGGGTVEQVITQLVRATGFRVERISSQGAEIDVIPQDDIRLFMNQELPTGVYALSRLDQCTVRVQFDPKVVGARDLMGSGFFQYSVALAPSRPDQTVTAGKRHVRKVGLLTLFSAVLTVPVLVMAWAPITPRPIPYGSASLALATLIQFIVAGPFYPDALRSLLLSGVIEMDLLIVLSTTAAYVFSVVAFGHLAAGQPLPSGDFFETSTLLVTLIMVGRLFSALARHKAVESISIRSLQALKALLIDEQQGSVTEIDARLLQFGDLFKVMPDSQIPTDGTVVSGTSEVDESMITGESTPVLKMPKSSVVAGSVNGSSALIVRLNRLPGDNTITTIAAMVDEAKLSKPHAQQVADRVATYFVPSVIIMATITFITWVVIGVKIRHYSGSEAAINAVTYAVTVLIVSCPCAIGLAVPMVVVIASGVAAEHGIIVKSASTIEVARKVTHVVFDKTGTLTEGKLKIAVEEHLSTVEDRATTLAILAGLVSNVKHPVSVAIATMLKERGVTPAHVFDIKTIPGNGVEGTHNGRLVRAGNSRWLGQGSHPTVEAFLSQGHTVFCMVIDCSISTVFGLSDSLRSSAMSVSSGLQSHGVQVSIVSGDDTGPVRSTAERLGISVYRAKCSPADKQAYLRDIVQNDPKAITLFVGDGSNDAIALAQATIGVHVSEGGTDVAASAANAVLAHPNLDGVPKLMDLSRAAMHRIAFNFAWSFIYNILAILLASGALVSARIPPEYGGLGELVSVLPVIIIALQLRWSKLGGFRSISIER